jgi:hypothetical protein
MSFKFIIRNILFSFIFSSFIICYNLKFISDSQNTEVSDVLKYFSDISLTSTINKNIHVYAYKHEYDYDLLTSVLYYLPETLEITENLAPEGNPNRPGTIKEKKYICVHDTGDGVFTAKEWSDIVKRASYESGEPYNCSFQYVVGNDGIYHNIPDNEVAYHAGDGVEFDYTLYDSGVFGSYPFPNISITDDGYYAIDGIKSIVEVPKKNDGTIPKTDEINNLGIRIQLINNKYYIGATWWSNTYKKIANIGGNLNSIGIESCLTKGSDIYYTWQKLAKLIAYLIHKNNLTIYDVKPHHFFSGKDCPQTIFHSDMYEHFMNLVQVELKVLEFINEGFIIKFESKSDIVNDKGRVLEWPLEDVKAKYVITVEKDGIKEYKEFEVIIPGKNNSN